MDEHRIGLKPIVRGVWAPVGERPIALGHHRFEWLYVTGFVDQSLVAPFNCPAPYRPGFPLWVRPVHPQTEPPTDSGR